MMRNRYILRFFLVAVPVLLICGGLCLAMHPAWGLIGMALLLGDGAWCLMGAHRAVRRATESVEAVARGDGIDPALLTEEGDLGALVGRLSLLADRLVQSARRHDADRLAMKRFVEDVSHQLKTPLAALRLELEARQLKQDDPMLDRALSHIDRMTFLIGALLKLARLESGSIEMKRRDERLWDVAAEAVDGLAPIINHKGQRVAVSGDESAVIRCDARFLGEAIGNILKNASEHGPEGSAIELRVERCEGGARVSVRDRGPGIPEDRLAHLFDRFQASGKDGGAGIGLALAKLIVDAHQGTLTAGNAEGGGAEFVVRLWG